MKLCQHGLIHGKEGTPLVGTGNGGGFKRVGMGDWGVTLTFEMCICVTPLSTPDYENLLFILFYFIHMCIQRLGHFSPLPPTPSLTPLTPRYQAETILPLSLILSDYQNLLRINLYIPGLIASVFYYKIVVCHCVQEMHCWAILSLYKHSS
jgi:hypothetical protein